MTTPPRPLFDVYEFFDGARRYAVARGGHAALEPRVAVSLLERLFVQNFVLRQRLAEWYRRKNFSIADDAVSSAALLRDVASGWVRVYELEPLPTPKYSHRFPSDYTRRQPAPAPAPMPEPEERTDRTLRRLQLGNLVYRPNGIVLLPNLSVPRSPWAALVVAARAMAATPGDTPMLCFHQASGEPAQTSELRARAMYALIRDEREPWVALQAEHGSIEDTQIFLSYLANVKSWPLTVRVTKQADTQTKAAVLAFQRFYNAGFADSIYEDGIVGRQTLAAIFSVLKVELSQWFQLNDADYAQLYHLPLSAYLACGTRYVGISEFSIGTYGGNPRTVDVVFLPSGEGFEPAANPAGSGIYVEDVRIHVLPIAGVRAPQSQLLVIRLVDQWGQPVAHADYELTVDGDNRVGTTDALGEIVEANVPEGVPLVKLADGRVIMFHDRYREALFKSPAPRTTPAYVPSDDNLQIDALCEDADELFAEDDDDGEGPE